MQQKANNTILIAPLDWGLGHATRCVPIIKLLQQQQCTIIVAATGNHKALLQQEFANLTYIDVPNYNITYGSNTINSILKTIPNILAVNKAIKAENKWVQQVVVDWGISIIISDNRYGVWHPKCTNIFITHQLQPKSFLFAFGEKLVRNYLYSHINKFSYCWVFDAANEQSLAGKLSHPGLMPTIPVTYIGVHTRLSYNPLPIVYKAAVILSGPEPQRSILEQKIIKQLQHCTHKIIMVRGLPITNMPLVSSNNNITIHNYLPSALLNTIINQSEFIISRSGYTSVMDLLLLRKKCIFIPTPSQSEQQYIATYLQHQNLCMAYSQSKFDINTALQNANAYAYVTYTPNANNVLQQCITNLLAH